MVGRGMRSAGFGRRVVELQGRELVLVPGPPPGPSVDLSGREEVKGRIRSALMSRIDPTVARRIGEDTLRAEVAKLVREIATEQRIELNESEERALAVELTHDMTGLGPLEPFLTTTRSPTSWPMVRTRSLS